MLFVDRILAYAEPGRSAISRIVLVAALILLVSGSQLATAQPAKPWPWSPTLATASDSGDDPASLLRRGLHAFAQSMPTLRRLNWIDWETGGPTQRYWNQPLLDFISRCPASDASCMELVHEQLVALQKALNEADDPTWRGQAPAILSAMAELCSRGYGLEQNFGLCGLRQRLDEAGAQWLKEGQDLLALHYLNRYLAQRQQFLDWQSSLEKPQDASILLALPELSPLIMAALQELRGELDDARWAWFMSYSRGLVANAELPLQASILTSLSAIELSRLSWRFGDIELARELEKLPTPYSDRQEHCLLKQVRVRRAIASAHAQGNFPAEAAAWISELQRDDCGHTQATQELVVDSLLRGEAYDAVFAPKIKAVLDQSLSVCERTQNCVPYRLAGLQTLRQAVWGPQRDLLDILTQRRLAQEQNGPVPDSERRLDWALGRAILDRSNGSTAQQVAALELLQAVQTQSLLAAQAHLQVSQTSQRNLSRYDDLHRLVARAQVQQGRALPLASSEVLRAQTLIRRLRSERLMQELKGEKDVKSDAEYQVLKLEVNKVRAIAQQPGVADTQLAQWIVRMVDDTQSFFETRRLEALAARRLERQGLRPTDWITRSMGGASIDLLTPRAERWQRSEGDRLSSQEAYLSWLQVADGFVATVLVQEGGQPRLSSHWVPFGWTDQLHLALWRDLLRSGGANPKAGGGASLRGKPIWRLADGTFVARGEAPAGAQQVQQASEVAQALSERLFGNLPAKIFERKLLIISPDGALAQLPFETLYLQGKPLTNGRDLVYVQSLSVWEELQRRAAALRPAGKPQLLSLAAPFYTLPQSAKLAESGAAIAETDWRFELNWPELNSAKAESDALLALYPSGQQWLDKQASVTRLQDLQRSGRLADFDLLHFATHGHVDDERSALVLSMHQGQGAAYLTDGQIGQLSLKSSLVLLSACETGLGRQQAGEGVMGLPYAFMLAGNIDTLMSLWAVEDLGTAVFMPVFMAKVAQGLDVVSALNETKREFSLGLHGPDFQDPQIWAAFVLYGVPLSLSTVRATD